MTNPDGPVLVGMDMTPDGTAATHAAVDLGAREARARGVDLRLVYGLDTLPDWAFATQMLDAVTAGVGAAHPGLAVTIALYPGSTVDALEAAADTASLVVLGSPLASLAGTRVLVADGAATRVPRQPLPTGR